MGSTGGSGGSGGATEPSSLVTFWRRHHYYLSFLPTFGGQPL